MTCVDAQNAKIIFVLSDIFFYIFYLNLYTDKFALKINRKLYPEPLD